MTAVAEGICRRPCLQRLQPVQQPAEYPADSKAYFYYFCMYSSYTYASSAPRSYSEQLKKWMEVGNSGMFRPEMLRPMGLPEDVSVIAWGLSLERPTMILYGIDNIRDLFGHKVALNMVKKNPICRLGL